MRFRSKVVEIDAIRWTGSNHLEIFEFADRAFFEDGLVIPTLEGEMRANVGDWIIRGTEGEFYPCRDSVFQAKYEPAL